MGKAVAVRGKRESGLDVGVPNQCFESKPWFPDRQSAEAVVKEIKEFVAQDGRPFMWRGHTHTKPPARSSPVYLDGIEIPERLKKSGRLSPCPCCTPKHAKFGIGRIAYFPDEGIIRLIGYRCFRSLNQEAHELAETELRQRKRREANVAYLLGHHDRLRRAYSVCLAAIPVARAIEAFSKALRRTFEQRLDLPIWSYVQHGFLPIYEETNELRADGVLVPISRQRSYAALRGYRILKPDQKSFLFRLEQVALGFKTAFDTEDWDEFVVGLADTERNKLASLINRSVGRGRDLLEDLRELQAFVSVLNVATVRNWGHHGGNPMPLAFQRSGMRLLIGRKETAMMTVRIPPELENPIDDIDVPLFSDLDADASP